MTNDIYTRVTNKIISDMEQGQLTWRQPWSDANLAGNVMRPRRWNDIPYSGINTIMLWGTAAEKGYTSPYWMTFKQALDMKAAVRKGEKGSIVVYADKMQKETEADNGETEQRQIYFLKSYTVFNAAQIDGLSEAFYRKPEPQEPVNREQRIAALETFFANTKAQIYTGTEAAYYLGKDKIEMPPFEAFNSAADYYAILSHELTHWTRHPSRLDRDFKRQKWGDEGYAKEELVAELGACSSVPISASSRSRRKSMPPIYKAG